MYISTQDIRGTLDNQLKTVAGLPQFTPENITNTANGITAFSRSTLLPARRSVLSLGTTVLVNQPGLYQVDLFYPTGFGIDEAAAMSDAVANAFPPASTLTLQSNNKLIIVATTVYPANSNPIEGAFLMIPVRVEWFINA